jgi:hypothetical protein
MLLQTSAEINMDPDAEEALGMLANQFPEEYPEDKPAPVPVKQPSAEELAATEKQEALAIS